MGFLDPKDWSAQWLAAETAVAKEDRQAGLHWIWGAQTQGKATHAFRFKFHLPVDATGGELYAVTNDMMIWTQITRIWLDGLSLAGTGEWLDADGRGEASTVQLDLASLRAGGHCLAVEVMTTTADLPAAMQRTLQRGLTAFLRLDLANGETLRTGSGLDWKTRKDPPRGWEGPEYADTIWESVVTAPMRFQPWPPQPAMLLHHEFSLDQTVTQARLYATALGAYEARLNGRRVSDRLLTPEIAQYDKRVLYQVCDATSLLQPGVNELHLLVGDGWYASFDGFYAWAPPPRRVLAQLELTFADGSRRTIGTGSDWSIAESPIRQSQMKVGEIYDARLDSLEWRPAEIGAVPSCRLTAQVTPPIRATETLKPGAISEPQPGVYVADFGQNFAGWCRLKAQGPRGTRIELRFAELLKPSGEVDQPYMNIGLPKVDVFILKGDPAGEIFEPHFCYRGFRYVQVTGLPVPPTAETLQGIVIHSDYTPTGQLRAGDPMIQSIWQNILWTQRSNLVGSVTDCCSREQRSHQATSPLIWDDATFNWDLAAYTARYLTNVRDDQDPDGALPHVAPEPRNNNALFLPPSWPETKDALIILPWTAWQRYGDTAVIRENWDSMNRYMDWALAQHPDYLWRMQDPWPGDWLSLDELKADSTVPAAPVDLTATARWAHCLTMLAEMADAIGLARDSKRLRENLDRIRQAFNEAFVKPDGTVGNGAQTNYVLALQFGLLPDGLKQAAAAKLAADVRSRGVSLTTGTAGTRFILNVLAESGYPDLAYGLLLRTEFPSWGYEIRNGATTIWESWSGGQEWSDPATKQIKRLELARNHAELATISGWLFRHIAGIDAATPGFETIVIRPVLDPRVKHGGGDFDSVMGRISTDWIQHPDGRFSLDVSIPANTSARVHLPAKHGATLKESRTELSRRRDMRIVARQGEEAVIEVGSGKYRFVIES
jgi:alpha-L-rhamnosidase